MAAVASTQPASHDARNALIAEAVILAVASTVVSVLPIGADVKAALTSGVGVGSGGAALWWVERRRSAEIKISEYRRAEVHKPLLLLVPLAAFALLLIDSVAGAAIGFIVDNAAESEIGREYGVAVGSFYVGLPVILLSAFFLARRLSMYAQRSGLRFWAMAVALFFVLRVCVVALFQAAGVLSFDWGPLLIGFAAFTIMLFGVCLLGWWASRRSFFEFVAVRLFRALSGDDRAAALEILHQAPPTPITGSAPTP